MPGLYLDIPTVVTRMQINADMEGVKSALTSSIQGAQMRVESLLQSGLEYKQQDSVFYLDKDAYSGIQPGNVFRLSLPDYFLRNDQDSPVLLTHSGNWKMTDPEPVDPAEYSVLYEQGQVLVDASRYADRYVRVQGYSGYQPEREDPDNPGQVLAAETVPDWLQEAILAYVGQVMSFSNVNEAGAAERDRQKAAAEAARTVLLPYMRRNGFTFRPLR